ncbi:3-dehydroquinate synthase [Enterococcus sp. PF1-24]|uniref:3-dehydroquinate synthase n=1 Tax=unclassified Enterococcus TaxID=2608891 RepID=UPI0024730AF7|nr:MULTISPECIES: 3-dehydroquinate synthase [unclassified Enterococcus]MDH6364181.1 3-dehydroquinate synthase [Enterococcus sp. PFB1-1]MDH6401282.1 3-dehydroquinate synthase [Enterococcus sp. PF1-24]
MLTVKLPHHQYDILIENQGLKQVGTWAAKLWQSQKIAVITDETVDGFYGEVVMQALQAAGFTPYKFVVPVGEKSKSLSQVSNCYDFLAEQQFTRSDGILALGGGVVGDLAGFVAATYMRGIHFLQVPTTLLAQVDSSIGGKTGVNTTKAKNLVGAFWQPDGVLIDIATLQTLETRRIREGIGEIIKYAAIADQDLWQLLDSFKDEYELLENAEAVILACLKIKKKVVEEDELDNGIRLNLNFGHTIGHAIENTIGYGVVTHGEAVAIGMIQISKAAEAKGKMPADFTNQLTTLVEKFGLPITCENWDEAELYQAITHDKKTRGSNLKLILVTAIGQAEIQQVAIEEMKDYLKK